MNILVTGGAGFLGSHLVDELVLQCYNVLVFDDLSRGEKSQVIPKQILSRGMSEIQKNGKNSAMLSIRM